jgi:hypothetical protein
MASDLDIYRAAKVLLDQHSDDAALSTLPAGPTSFSMRSVSAGTAGWRRIMAAVEELQWGRGPGEEVNWGSRGPDTDREHLPHFSPTFCHRFPIGSGIFQR